MFVIAFISTYLSACLFKTGRSLDVDLQGNYFCKFPCGYVHTACCEAPCRIQERNCGKGAQTFESTEYRVNILIHIHNKWRSQIAMGAVHGLPSASNMNVLSYSYELEFIAQCWSNACLRTLQACTSTSSYERHGETNVYLENSEQDLAKITFFADLAFQSWMEEARLMKAEYIKSYVYKKEYGNFSQVAWANSKIFGCGSTMFKKGIWFLCLYGPRGNIVGEPIYNTGKPCSACDPGIKCNQYHEGLCGEIEWSDSWTPPFPLINFGGVYKSSIRYINVFIIVIMLT